MPAEFHFLRPEWLWALPLVGLVRLAFLEQIRRIGMVRLLSVTAAARLVCVLLLIVLLIRPEGLFGQKRIERI